MARPKGEHHVVKDVETDASNRREATSNFRTEQAARGSEAALACSSGYAVTQQQIFCNS